MIYFTSVSSSLYVQAEDVRLSLDDSFFIIYANWKILNERMRILWRKKNILDSGEPISAFE